MARVTGIGGLFFRTRYPAAMADWYRTHLGISTGNEPWQQDAGPTVFAPFPADSDYFPADRHYMLNLRVDDLAGLIVSLKAAGVVVETKAEWDGEWGKFARIHDPEGNPVELWQAPAE